MKRTALASAIVVSLALLPFDAEAQHRGGARGGGGSRGGGGARGSWQGGGGHAVPRSGYGRAVPRSGYGQPPRGGASYVRHPRAGTGSYGYYGGYYGGYGHGYKGHGYYGGHYPYYPYYPYYRPYYYGAYYPYYSPWYGSLYWGWPYGGAGVSVGISYGGAYVSGSYAATPAPAPAPSYSVAAPERPAAPQESVPPEIEGEWGRVRLEVRPLDATVYVDDRFLGSARDLRSLRLPPGRHTIELVRPGYAVERREVDVVKDERVDVLVELQPSVRPPV